MALPELLGEEMRRLARERKKKLDLSEPQEVTLGDLFKLAGRDLPAGEGFDPERKVKKESPSLPRASKIVLRRERKGRKGKTVTLVEGLELRGKDLEEMARDLRRELGCGSHVESDVVVLHGDQVERAEGLFQKKGFRNIVRGS
jgi:translation initiation factor 1